MLPDRTPYFGKTLAVIGTVTIILAALLIGFMLSGAAWKPL